MNSIYPLFLKTIYIYGFIFVFASVLTFFFKKTNWGRNMFAAILNWFVIFVLFLLTAYANNIVFTMLIFCISFLGIREYYILNNRWTLANKILSAFLLILTFYSLIFKLPELFYLIPVITILLFFISKIVTSQVADINKNVGIEVTGFLYWAWLTSHFVLLHQLENGFGYIIFLCTLIALNDNSAYYFGKLLGKNSKKLAPKISPGKTWTGTIGGFAMTILFGFGFRYLLPHFSTVDLLLLVPFTGLIIPIGDLIESAIKRDIGVKDSGNLIKGHGGIMDRFDSWVFTAPVIYYFIIYIIK